MLVCLVYIFHHTTSVGARCLQKRIWKHWKKLKTLTTINNLNSHRHHRYLNVNPKISYILAGIFWIVLLKFYILTLLVPNKCRLRLLNLTHIWYMRPYLDLCHQCYDRRLLLLSSQKVFRIFQTIWKYYELRSIKR